RARCLLEAQSAPRVRPHDRLGPGGAARTRGRPRHQLHRADRIAPADPNPPPPLNLVGDFGGGGMLLAFGIACALVERGASGKGQVVDAAMVDGAAILMAMIHGMRQHGMWKEERA